jgi:hypothetical protein
MDVGSVMLTSQQIARDATGYSFSVRRDALSFYTLSRLLKSSLVRALVLCALAALALLACAGRVGAQETVFDVPSADILDRGKVYGELDGTVRPVDPMATFTPRVVIGIGHGIEIGANFNGLATPDLGELTFAPTIKWRPWHTESGWSFYVGDDVFFPVYNRTFNAGNYGYAMFAKQWKKETRVGAGAYDFTRNVVAAANRAGGQFTVPFANYYPGVLAEWVVLKYVTDRRIKQFCIWAIKIDRRPRGAQLVPV